MGSNRWPGEAFGPPVGVRNECGADDARDIVEAAVMAERGACADMVCAVAVTEGNRATRSMLFATADAIRARGAK